MIFTKNKKEKLIVVCNLQGKGQSPGPLEEQYWDTFLAGVISGLDLTDLVVVSPSSGGKYAMPYLFKVQRLSPLFVVQYIK